MIRSAGPADIDALRQLIERSARTVGVERYTAEQMETALRGAFGVDSQLITDGTYFLVEFDDGMTVACGGWSWRRTLFGGDKRVDREVGTLDPRTDAAKIRAFFVDPQHLRQGIASSLLARCEAEARAAGFLKLELMGTLTGEAFYTARGYVRTASVSYEAEPGVFIPFVAMSKEISHP
jgi:N-acetylglutamate synthase-like GNAT family acetyltransferase